MCRVVDFDFVSTNFLLYFGTVLKVWDFLHFNLIFKFQIKEAFTCNHIVFLTTFSIKKSDNLISNHVPMS